MAGHDGRKRFLSANRRGHDCHERSGGREMRFLGHGDVAPAASVDRALLWPAAGVTGFHPADPLIFFVSFRQIPKVGESMWRCVPFCEEPMLQIPRPTPTCTRFKPSIEMPCMKCGTQMRLTLVE